MTTGAAPAAELPPALALGPGHLTVSPVAMALKYPPVVQSP